MSNSSIGDQLKEQIKDKTGHSLKFSAFLSKNSDAPYVVKRKVWHSALMSALFYSCESWLTRDLKAAEKVYMTTLKQMMSVRTTTCTDIVLLESGEIGAKGLIRMRQYNFLRQLFNRVSFNGSYLEQVINKARESNTVSGRLITELMDDTYPDCVTEITDRRKQSVMMSNSTRRKTYRDLNPTLSTSPVYSDEDIPEWERKAFTRMRLSSHDLAFEKG